MRHLVVRCICLGTTPVRKIYISQFVLPMYETTFLIPVAAPYMAWVSGRSLAKTVVSNAAGGMDVSSLVTVVRCQVEVSS
jgi:hypothetical protein